MSPHIERSQHVTPCLIYSRWIDRGHHRQVDHARSSHYLLDDCTGNYRLHHWRRRYSYVCASARSAFSYGRSYFLHVGCDPGAICLLKTQDSISARVESRGNSGVSWLLEAIDLQDSDCLHFRDGQAESVDEMGNSTASSATARSVLGQIRANNLKGHELRMRVRPRHGL
jgi:hypothetical protein